MFIDNVPLLSSWEYCDISRVKSNIHFFFFLEFKTKTTKTTTFSEKSLQKLGPKIWNPLP